MSSLNNKVFKEFYKVIENFGYAAIVYDRITGRLEYLVIEPELNEEERRLLEKIKSYIIETCEPDIDILRDRKAMEEYIKRKFEEIIKKYKLKIRPESRDKIAYYLVRDLLGYGELEVMMKDPNIEDISCDGVGLPVYVWHRRYESLPSNIVYKTNEDLMRTLNRLAYKAGKQISVAFPIVEGALPEGYRVHLTLSEISRRGGTFTIRKFREEPYTVIDLIKFGTMSPLLGAYLWLLIDLKRSAMVLGVTGSGKTTTLNAIAMFIRPEAKIVTIEDTPEINLPHENWIPLVTRPSHEAWRMNVTLYELLRTALRQRPDYIIVGEIRGEEAYTLFQAIATGHAGLSTMHAENVRYAIKRLETRPMNVPKELIPMMNVFIEIARIERHGTIFRRIIGVYEALGLTPDGENVELHQVFRWDPISDRIEFTGKSLLLEKMPEMGVYVIGDLMEELRVREAILRKLVELDVRSFKEVAKVIREYYYKPESVKRKFMVGVR